MAGKVHKDKVKITYGEWIPVVTELGRIAKELNRKLGRKGKNRITITEMIRVSAREKANRNRKKRGERPLTLSPWADYYLQDGKGSNHSGQLNGHRNGHRKNGAKPKAKAKRRPRP